jgi:hypothetical protein
VYLSFIDLERGGFGEILPEVMILNIITDIAINFMRMPTLHELSFLIGQFEFEV